MRRLYAKTSDDENGNECQECINVVDFALGNKAGQDDLLRYLPDLCLYKLCLN